MVLNLEGIRTNKYGAEWVSFSRYVNFERLYSLLQNQVPDGEKTITEFCAQFDISRNLLIRKVIEQLNQITMEKFDPEYEFTSKNFSFSTLSDSGEGYVRSKNFENLFVVRSRNISLLRKI